MTTPTGSETPKLAGIETPNEIEIDIRYYLYTLRNNWGIVALAGFGAMLLALIISLLLTPIYQSSTTLFIDVGQATRGESLNDIRTSESLARTYAEMLRSGPILNSTIEELDLASQGIGPAKLRSAISVSPVANTQLLRIRVEDSDNQRAANIANSLAGALIEELDDIQAERFVSAEERVQSRLTLLEEQINDNRASITALGDATGSQAEAERAALTTTLADLDREYAAQLSELREVRVDVANSAPIVDHFELATASSSPVRPRTAVNTIAGLILGLMAAIGVIFARELMNTTVRDPDELSRRFGLPILGQISNFDAQNEGLITALRPRTPAAESFRSLRLNLKYASVDSNLHSVLITSPAPSEGKSTLASNLSAAIALSGQDVLLIDGDMRRPRVHKALDLPNRDGLSDLFIESVDALPQMVQKTSVPKLSAIVAGPTPPNPSELLDTNKSAQIIEAATDHAAMVIVDAPPVAAMSDAIALSQYVDGVIVAVRAGKTTIGSVEHAVQRLKQVNANILGFSITDIDNVFTKGVYYYNYYGGYSDAYAKYFNEDDDDDDKKTPDAQGKKKRRRSTNPAKQAPSGVSGWLLGLFKS